MDNQELAIRKRLEDNCFQPWLWAGAAECVSDTKALLEIIDKLRKTRSKRRGRYCRYCKRKTKYEQTSYKNKV